MEIKENTRRIEKACELIKTRKMTGIPLGKKGWWSSKKKRNCMIDVQGSGQFCRNFMRLAPSIFATFRKKKEIMQPGNKAG